eukprot:NODE_4793_length_764_cov_7.341259_g3997_i0.p1 GENE.NODE_4793_length_764_cov_7.341259_g3997_i0~~NODE_4793_length_764_cov_7.341259_g3997_i0.p1  ORF type:complete len:167 (+),score=19.09 NODE_4793_length_764_cov_7.341259_g3997_i0:150-650(+)
MAEPVPQIPSGQAVAAPPEQADPSPPLAADQIQAIQHSPGGETTCDATGSSGPLAIVKSADMIPELQQDIVDCAYHALTDGSFSTQASIAKFIKQELDSKYGPTFHVIVGQDFGSYISYVHGQFFYFHIKTAESGDLGFLVWKSISCGLLTDVVPAGPSTGSTTDS